MSQDVPGAWPLWAPYTLWRALNRWAQWRESVAAPRSGGLPNPAHRYGLDGKIIATEARLPAGTAPGDDSWLWDFSKAFTELDRDSQQVHLLALLELQAEPYPEGRKWQTYLSTLRLTTGQLEMLVSDALHSLQACLRDRHLA